LQEAPYNSNKKTDKESMKKYKEIQAETPENFKRLTGLSKENFQHLCRKVDVYLSVRKRNPLKRFKKIRTFA